MNTIRGEPHETQQAAGAAQARASGPGSIWSKPPAAEPSPATGPRDPGAGRQLGEPRGHRILLGAARLWLRIILALAALAVLASPFAVAFYLHYQAQWVGPQVDTPLARLSAAELSQFHRAALAATHAPSAEPIVLAYHDIAWQSVSQYVVTPRAFAAQMAMLHAAGYHSLTARQLVSYLHGGAIPSRSVAITFDDGPRGLWTYADKVLARYHFHGIAFIITGRVGTHMPYYLTWQEIQRLYATGRWDFESHTDDLEREARLTASGRIGAPMVNEIWLASKHRRETFAEFRTRVRNDLLDSISDLTENHLPRPSLFAYPFSVSRGVAPYVTTRYANKLVRGLFAGAMTDYVDPAVPLSHREETTGVISRLEVGSADTAETLFTRMQQAASIPTADASALADLGHWAGENGKPADITVSGRKVTFTGKNATWAYAAYAPGETADWDRYRLSVLITQLNPKTDPSATVSVRVGSRSEVNVNVANHYVEVRFGSVHNSKTVLARALPAASAHRLTIEVRATMTVVSVGGHTIMKRRVPPGPAGTGGFSLSSFRPDARYPFARFTRISLARLAP